MTKPFRKEELLCRVNTHVELKQARDLMRKQTEDLREASRFIMGTLHQMSRFINEEK